MLPGSAEGRWWLHYLPLPPIPPAIRGGSSFPSLAFLDTLWEARKAVFQESTPGIVLSIKNLSFLPSFLLCYLVCSLCTGLPAPCHF